MKPAWAAIHPVPCMQACFSNPIVGQLNFAGAVDHTGDEELLLDELGCEALG